MVDLMYAQVIQTLIDLTREQKLTWEVHELSKYADLEPESIVEKPYFTRFKDRNLLFFEERMPPYKADSETVHRIRFLDEKGAFIGDFPNSPNMDKLYHIVKIWSRSEVAKQLDKVVEALALATKANQVTWTEEKPEPLGIEPDTLTSPVYVTEFKGKKFALFYEHDGDSTRKHVHTRPALWIFTPDNKKLRDCLDVLGVDILFRMVNTKQPDFSALDKVIDTIVASTIKDVVGRMNISAG
ncbi:MAG: hypothetical protein MUF71_10985 [Candidatus Kapabacteria bacterium]|jgi:hypothetical protein|nr:hypothetical protein [Candidatus Kapabacteria bacterium]